MNESYTLNYDGEDTLTIDFIKENEEINIKELIGSVIKVDEYKKEYLNVILNCEEEGNITNLILQETFKNGEVPINYHYKNLIISSINGALGEESSEGRKQIILKNWSDDSKISITTESLSLSYIELHYIGEKPEENLNFMVSNSQIIAVDDKEYKFNIVELAGDSNYFKGSHASLFYKALIFSSNDIDIPYINCDVSDVYLADIDNQEIPEDIEITFTESSNFKNFYIEAPALKYNITFPKKTKWELKIPEDDLNPGEKILEINVTKDNSNISKSQIFQKLNSLTVSFNKSEDESENKTDRFYTFDKEIDEIKLQNYENQDVKFTFEGESNTKIYTYKNEIPEDINNLIHQTITVNSNSVCYSVDDEKNNISNCINITCKKASDDKSVSLVNVIDYKEEEEIKQNTEIIEIKPFIDATDTNTITIFEDVKVDDQYSRDADLYNRQTEGFSRKINSDDLIIREKNYKDYSVSLNHPSLSDCFNIKVKGTIKGKKKNSHVLKHILKYYGMTETVSNDMTIIFDNQSGSFTESFKTEEKCNINVSSNTTNNITLNFVEKEDENDNSETAEQIQFKSLSLNTNSTVLLNFPDTTTQTPDIETIEILGDSKISFQNLNQTTETLNIIIPYGKKINDVLVGDIPKNLSYKITNAKPTEEQKEEIKKEIKKLSSILLLFSEYLTYSEKYLFKLKILKLLREIEIME